MLEYQDTQLSLKTQAALLGLSRSSVYYTRRPPLTWEVQAKRRLDALFTAHPYYGSRRMTFILQQEMTISRPTVQKFMREMGLVALAPGPNTSQPAPGHIVYPYLLRHLAAAYPNHIWGVDITYIRLRAGWLYLVAILDWYARLVITWELSDSLEQAFVNLALDRALALATPAICNSDQGSHFTSPQYTGRLLAAEVQISMDGRGRALDNIFTERFWRSLKYEEVYLQDYATPREARLGIAHYIDFYNHERPHQALDYQTPAQVYATIPPTLKIDTTLF